MKEVKSFSDLTLRTRPRPWAQIPVNVSVSGLCEEMLRPVLFPNRFRAFYAENKWSCWLTRAGAIRPHSCPFSFPGIILGGRSWSRDLATNYRSLGYSAHRAWGRGDQNMCNYCHQSSWERCIHVCSQCWAVCVYVETQWREDHIEHHNDFYLF